MLYIDHDAPKYYLWRLMVDEQHQKKGFALLAMHQVIDFVRSQPKAEELLVSYVPGEGSPKGFYDKLGFTETGLMDGDERVMRVALEP
jgi:diamine N-acetyltransferase